MRSSPQRHRARAVWRAGDRVDAKTSGGPASAVASAARRRQAPLQCRDVASFAEATHLRERGHPLLTPEWMESTLTRLIAIVVVSRDTGERDTKGVPDGVVHAKAVP